MVKNTVIEVDGAATRLAGESDGCNVGSEPHGRTLAERHGRGRDALLVFVEATRASSSLDYHKSRSNLDRVASPGSGGRSGSFGSIRT